MPEPINYLGMVPQVNPLASLTQGLQAGAIIGQARDQALAQQQTQDRVKAYQSSLQDYFANPSHQKLLQMQVAFPEQKEAFAPLVKDMSEKQLNNELTSANQVSNALGSGNTDLALNLVDQHIEAMKNSGIDTSTLDNIKSTIQNDPTHAKAMLDFTIANLMGPDKFAKLVEAQGKQQEQAQSAELFPSKKAEQVAKAAQETVKAKYIEPQTLQKIQETGINMKKMLADIDIARQNAKTAALNAAYNREGNDLKRQELGLKLQESQMNLNNTIREKMANAQSAYATSDNILNSIDRILAVPKSVRESAHGPISSKIPTLSSDTADYEALLDTLGSQAFLSQVSSMKGMGALSDAEGKKLTQGLQNLSLTQSADQAERNVREIKNIMLKARKNMEIKTGIKAPPIETSFKSSADTAAIFSKYGIK